MLSSNDHAAVQMFACDDGASVQMLAGNDRAIEGALPQLGAGLQVPLAMIAPEWMLSLRWHQCAGAASDGAVM